jgi:hypothetical protein
MKKYLVLIAIVMVLAFAGTVIAEEQFFPPRNNTGQIGKSGRVWREGNFYNGNFTGTLTATGDLYYITTASKDFGWATAIWELSATEAQSRILFASGATPEGAVIVAPSAARSYIVYNYTNWPLRVKATGTVGMRIATGTGQEVIFVKIPGLAAGSFDYILAGASFPVQWGSGY